MIRKPVEILKKIESSMFQGESFKVAQDLEYILKFLNASSI